MKLAIHGGSPVRTKPFPAHITVGIEEKEAATRVLDSGVLSRYLGAWHVQFMGGPEVQALEQEWAAHYGVKHALAVNSCTSGLIAALGAVGIRPGDEVIVGPWSMSISATAPLFYGGIPVFADVEPDCFCLDPASVEARITPRTKAILAVDLFGQPYDADIINALAKKHGLYVIEDCAQAPGASYKGRPAGTLGDIGVYSLNYHKHIHCGEGGIIVTNNDALAQRLSLIRNHAESVVEGMGVQDQTNMLGYNFRMTELDAAVARCQLKKLQGLNAKRLKNVALLEQGLSQIPCLTMPKVRDDCVHVYYVHTCLYDEKKAGVPAHRFVEALKAELPHFRLREKEGTKLGVGYVKPLNQLPIFHNLEKQPAGLSEGALSTSYDKGICPMCEQLHEGGCILSEFMLPCLEAEDVADVVEAFQKIYQNRMELNASSTAL